jgi:hypothetical protein
MGFIERGRKGFLANSLALKGFAIECYFGALDFFHDHHHHLAEETWKECVSGWRRNC